MPTVTVRLSDKQYAQIKEKATKKNTTITEYIISSCGVNNFSNDLTLKDVISKVKDQPSGSKFSLRIIYDYDTWLGFSKASRLSVGRTFFQSLNANKFDLAKIVEFIGKDSNNTAIYKRL